MSNRMLVCRNHDFHKKTSPIYGFKNLCLIVKLKVRNQFEEAFRICDLDCQVCTTGEAARNCYHHHVLEWRDSEGCEDEEDTEGLRKTEDTQEDTQRLLTLQPSSSNLPPPLTTSHRSGLNLITRLKSTRTLVPTSRATEARHHPDPTNRDLSRAVSTLEPRGTRSTRPVQQKHGTHVPTPTPWRQVTGVVRQH